MPAQDKHTGRPNEDSDSDEAGIVEVAVSSALAAVYPATGRPHIPSNATTVDEKAIRLKTANPPQPRIQVPLRSVSTVTKIIVTQITVPTIQ